jgi:lipopolysaccharide transport system permease protein
VSNIKDIILVLTEKELKVRYNSNVLGYFWSIGNPLFHALIYWIIFGHILNSKVPNYAVFLITALFPWQWMQNSIAVAPMTFLGNGPIIKKVNFPRFLISLVAVIQDMIHFWASLPIIFIFLIYYKISPSLLWLIGIPILTVIQLIITYSLNLMLATINLFFRDMERLVQIFMMTMFYFTPILYDASQIPLKYQKFIFIHPVAPLMISWRKLFMEGTINWMYVLQSAIVATILLGISQTIYKKLSWRFAEIL